MKILIAVVSWAALAGAAPAPQQSAKGINFYSLEKERELGRQLASRLQTDLPIVHEPKLDAYVTQLGAGLARVADSPFDYTFVLYRDRDLSTRPPAFDINSPTGLLMPVDALNGHASEPIAVPGGTIFIPLSMLANAPSEPVFAFQLAHSMAHVAARHGTRWATRVELMQISVETMPISTQPNMTIPLGMLAFARADERMADYYAVRIVSQGGYDPAPMAEYLSSQPDPKQRALSAYPPPSERAKAIRAEIEKMPATGYAAAIARFTEAKALAAGIR